MLQASIDLALAQQQGSRVLTTEDLMFLIRHNQAKVNQLRNYLGWKDVRKKAKDNGTDEKDIESIEAESNGQNNQMKFHYTDMLIVNEETKDQDDKEAYEAFEKHLKKSVGLSNCIESNPTDEVVDILGFRSYKMLRSLCERGLAVKHDYKLARMARVNGTDGHDDDYDGSEDFKRPKPSGPFSVPSTPQPNLPSFLTLSRTSFLEDPFGITDKSAGKVTEKEIEGGKVFVPEPTRSPLRIAGVEDAYLMMRMGRVKTKTSALRNFTGGFVRNKVSLIVKKYYLAPFQSPIP
ncbi:uncharacterized protein MELLADRAFT_88588 [Melampsora larici-populina 98AG31]|uniref:Uncharacterized protein n=1 Tax=Melampsora larici-populina (strain 98AG31 / pathotype 3-4-7) TaxID=747676 RepID=F4RSA0_MELLP|nr:uncharacterized protein MELLADRAFT_88588 [Melampsora larici-populina 98AG31]EGG04562.1 hypothetical protein MELLADRAFT_88588 [Melampsora larici-populina 98AG31]